jgi:CHAT domain-containing protein
MSAALLLATLVVGLGTTLGGAGQLPAEVDEARARALYLEGKAAYSAAQYPEAIASFEQALVLYRAVGDRRSEGVTRFYLSQCYYVLSGYRTAIGYGDGALAIFRKLGDRASESASLDGLGRCYKGLKDYPKAIECHEASLAISRELGNRAWESVSLDRLGRCHEALADYPKAIECHEESLAISRELGDRAGEAVSLSRLGICYYSLADYQRAIDLHEQALAIQGEFGDRAGEAVSLDRLGRCHEALADYRKAIECHEESLAISRELGDRAGEAVSLNRLGICYYSLADYQRASDLYEQGLPIADYERASDLYEQALPIADYQRAMDLYEQALAIWRHLRDGRIIAWGWGDEDYWQTTDPEITTTDPAIIQERIVECEEAIQGCRDALAALNQIPQLGEMPYSLAAARWMLLTNLGTSYESLGQTEEAQESYESAIEIAESVRSRLSSEEQMRSWWDRVDVIYWHVVDLMVREGQGVAAFQFVERCRARTLLDLLAKGPTNPSVARMEAGIQSGVVDAEQIQADVEAVRSSLPEDTVAVEYFVTDTASYVWVVTREGTSEPAILPYGNSQLVDKVIACRQKIEGLDLGANRDLAELYDWLVRPVENLLPLPAVAESLEAHHLVIVPSGPLYYLPFQALLWTSSDRSQSARLVEQYAVSYAPSLASLKYTQHQTSESEAASCFLGLADPSTATPRLPEAQTEVQEVADAFTCSEVYVGAAATEEIVRLRSEQATFLLLSTHGMFNTTNPVFSYLVLDQTQEEDGKLCTYEVSSLPLRKTDLVVLSACETLLPGLEDMRCQIRETRGSAADEPITLSEQQLSDLTRGDELVGLTRAFLAAGASSVLSSLWAVPPAATASLVVAFYRGVEAGSDRAEALRLAQLGVMRTTGCEQPWYWAAFNLVGDWL